MYCHLCGAKGQGNYCHKCGAKLITAENNHEPPADWSDEIRYEILLRRPEIRDLIARHASQKQTQMSGEQFLELCDKALAPLYGGIPMAKIINIAQPLYASLGIKTGETRKEFLALPAGKTLVAAVCSLARHGQPVNRVEQAEDGCLLEAGLPSDIWSFGGDLILTVQRLEEGSSVEAATAIKGQIYDWGKSKRALDKLFDDIKTLPV
jgi:hypothetical protein